MVFRARELGIEVRLARMEDPLPDGPWDLVVSVLSVHHLDDDAEARPVPPRPRAVAVDGDRRRGDRPTPRSRRSSRGSTCPSTAEDLAEWCGGEIVWQADDLAVIRAVYD